MHGETVKRKNKFKTEVSCIASNVWQHAAVESQSYLLSPFTCSDKPVAQFRADKL